MFTLRRIYDDPRPAEKYCVLVDRLWPRGLSKENAGIDEWMKEIAPSDELRKWYHHDLEKWEEFRHRYIAELRHKDEQVTRLLELEKEHGNVTLLFAAKDEEHNNAKVLHDFLE